MRSSKNFTPLGSAGGAAAAQTVTIPSRRMARDFMKSGSSRRVEAGQPVHDQYIRSDGSLQQSFSHTSSDDPRLLFSSSGALSSILGTDRFVPVRIFFTIRARPRRLFSFLMVEGWGYPGLVAD